jgi:hypothetical protein
MNITATVNIAASHILSARTALCVVARLRFAEHALAAVLAGAMFTLLAAGGRAWAVEPWPEVPLPPKADVQWVAQSMRVNGVPTRVMQFQSRADRTEIVAYYRAYWSGYKYAPSIHAMGEAATVVGQMHGPYVMTVKVEDAPHGAGSTAASVGLISVAQVIGSKVERDPGQLPLMNGAHVLSVVESDDPGKHSRTVVVLTPQPPTSVTQFYQTSFVNAGWLQVQGNNSANSAHPPGAAAGSFVVFERGEDEMQLNIVATRGGRGSTLLANLVTKDTGFGAN